MQAYTHTHTQHTAHRVSNVLFRNFQENVNHRIPQCRPMCKRVEENEEWRKEEMG